MFLSYDGQGGAFGDASVRATTSDVASATVYAATDVSRDDRLTLVATNKTDRALVAGVAVRHVRRFARAEVYRLTGTAASPRRAADVVLFAVNALRLELPPQSVSTIVLRP